MISGVLLGRGAFGVALLDVFEILVRGLLGGGKYIIESEGCFGDGADLVYFYLTVF